MECPKLEVLRTYLGSAEGSFLAIFGHRLELAKTLLPGWAGGIDFQCECRTIKEMTSKLTCINDSWRSSCPDFKITTTSNLSGADRLCLYFDENGR